MRRNKREKFEEKGIIEVDKLDYQKSEHSLDDTKGTFTIDHRTEQDAQKKTKILWYRQSSSDGEEDEEDVVDNDVDGRLSQILFARLACISNLCPKAGYSNKRLKSEMQLDIELDCYGDESNIQAVKKDASGLEKGRDKGRKAARTEWAKSTNSREALSPSKRHLQLNVYFMAPEKPHKIVIYCEYLSALYVLEVGI